MKEIPGVTVYPSCTNFLLVQVDKKQEEIFEALRKKIFSSRFIETAKTFRMVSAFPSPRKMSMMC